MQIMNGEGQRWEIWCQIPAFFTALIGHSFDPVNESNDIEIEKQAQVTLTETKV